MSIIHFASGEYTKCGKFVCGGVSHVNFKNGKVSLGMENVLHTCDKDNVTCKRCKEWFLIRVVKNFFIG